MQSFIWPHLQSNISYYTTGLEEENFCFTLHFVELPVYLTAIRRANISAPYSYAGTLGCIAHLTYAYTLWFCCPWRFSKSEALEKSTSYVFPTTVIDQFLLRDLLGSSKCYRSCMLWPRLHSWSSSWKPVLLTSRPNKQPNITLKVALFWWGLDQMTSRVLFQCEFVCDFILYYLFTNHIRERVDHVRICFSKRQKVFWASSDSPTTGPFLKMEVIEVAVSCYWNKQNL